MGHISKIGCSTNGSPWKFPRRGWAALFILQNGFSLQNGMPCKDARMCFLQNPWPPCWQKHPSLQNGCTQPQKIMFKGGWAHSFCGAEKNPLQNGWTSVLSDQFLWVKIVRNLSFSFVRPTRGISLCKNPGLSKNQKRHSRASFARRCAIFLAPTATHMSDT